MDNARKLIWLPQKSSKTTDASVNVIWTLSAFSIVLGLTSVNCIQDSSISLLCLKSFIFLFLCWSLLKDMEDSKSEPGTSEDQTLKSVYKVRIMTTSIFINLFIVIHIFFWFILLPFPLLVYTVSNPWWCNSWIIFTGFYILFLRKAKW